jgi:hypothetical protein
MKPDLHFHAPWSTAVKLITVLATGLLVGVAMVGSRSLPADTPGLARFLVQVLPIAIVLGTLPFMVRGYVITGRELRIARLGWENCIPLRDIVSATADPAAMRWSIRLFGSGGLFGFFGWFRNRKLGTYRAYGTDPSNAVVIKLRQRTIVVTPHDPAAFVTAVREHQKPT